MTTRLRCSVSCTGSRCGRESSSSCVCWRTVDSTVPHPTTLLRPFIQSLAMAPDSVYDLPTRQLYLCHPHAAQLLAIAHFRRLPHKHGTLYHNRFRMRLLFLSSDGNWRLCCSSRPFRLTNNMSRAVYQRRTVTCPATLTESDSTVVLQQKCDNATLIIFISTTTI